MPFRSVMAEVQEATARNENASDVGEIDPETAENIAALAIPAAAVFQDDGRVYFSEMLSIPIGNTNTCSYCGYSRWWTKSCGQRICDACHPNPWGEDYISNVV